jgi:hypothetical protein
MTNVSLQTAARLLDGAGDIITKYAECQDVRKDDTGVRDALPGVHTYF